MDQDQVTPRHIKDMKMVAKSLASAVHKPVAAFRNA
jgi:hypothetical protein